MPSTPSRSRAAAAAPDRLVWVDVARGLALVSMMIAHTAPSSGPGGVLNLSEHLTAALFAALVGVSARLEVQHLGLGRAVARAAIRAVALFACAWLTAQFGAAVYDILAHLAVVTLLMSLLAALPLGAQLALALVSGGAGILAAAQDSAPLVRLLTPLGDVVGLSPAELTTGVESLLTDPPYRLPTLLAWALLGAVLVRTVRSASTTTAGPTRAARLTGLWWAIGGTALAGVVTALSRAQTGAMPTPYSGTAAEVLLDTGLVAAVLGLCAAVVPARASRGTDLLAVAGAMTLSVYVAHHAYLGWVLRAGAGPWVDAAGRDDTWFNVAVLVAGALLLPLLWRAVVRVRPWRAGPIEGVVRLATDPIRRR